jgi:hypothetical protein
MRVSGRQQHLRLRRNSTFAATAHHLQQPPPLPVIMLPVCQWGSGGMDDQAQPPGAGSRQVWRSTRLPLLHTTAARRRPADSALHLCGLAVRPLEAGGPRGNVQECQRVCHERCGVAAAGALVSRARRRCHRTTSANHTATPARRACACVLTLLLRAVPLAPPSCPACSGVPVLHHPPAGRQDRPAGRRGVAVSE